MLGIRAVAHLAAALGRSMPPGIDYWQKPITKTPLKYTLKHAPGYIVIDGLNPYAFTTSNLYFYIPKIIKINKRNSYEAWPYSRTF